MCYYLHVEEFPLNSQMFLLKCLVSYFGQMDNCGLLIYHKWFPLPILSYKSAWIQLQTYPCSHSEPSPWLQPHIWSSTHLQLALWQHLRESDAKPSKYLGIGWAGFTVSCSVLLRSKFHICQHWIPFATLSLNLLVSVSNLLWELLWGSGRVTRWHPEPWITSPNKEAVKYKSVN